MTFKLDNDFYVEGDKNFFILHYEHETGELNEKGYMVLSRDQWYYPTLKLCLESYLDRAVGDMGKCVAREILNKYNESVTQIKLCSELSWSNKDTRILKLEEENKELKRQLKSKK